MFVTWFPKVALQAYYTSPAVIAPTIVLNANLLFASTPANENLTDLVCAAWDVNMDDWWTHRPDWEVTVENDTHICFQRFVNNETRHLLEQAYNIMWKSNCSETFTWAMYSSGWSADLAHVAEGIIYAVGDQKPFAIAFQEEEPWWHYAAIKLNGSNPTCEARDMSCYFLPIGACNGSTSQIDKYKPKTRYSDFDDYFEREAIVILKYITRPKQWLRKAVYDYNKAKAPKLDGKPCTVMHVRRGDVVLHGEHSRRYFPISDYINKLPPERKDENSTILLLTDDANAVDEAKEFYPDINWNFYNRTRFRGTSGGWENTAPSKSPKMEVVIILSTLQLVQQCDALVYGRSSFASVVKHHMIATGKTISSYKVDQQIEVQSSASSMDSHLKLQEHLALLRIQRNISLVTNSR